MAIEKGKLKALGFMPQLQKNHFSMRLHTVGGTVTTEQVRAAAEAGADRVELYTKPYADNYAADREAAILPFVKAAEEARKSGIGLNAGHDLNLENLEYFHKMIPWLDEVSIGHALISDALYLGIKETIRRYLACLC